MARRRSRKKATKPAKAKAPQERSTRAQSRAPQEGRGLRRLSDRFAELRFEPSASHRDLVSVVLLSFGALGLGAGIYAQWFWRAGESPGYAPFVLAGGVILLVVYAFYAPATQGALFVGELGVGVENEGRVQRTAWYEITALTFAHDAVVLKTTGKPLLIPIKDHPAAARLIVAEAKRRIPKNVELSDDEVAQIGPPTPDEGEAREADPPQVTDLTCMATDQPLNIEKDVRMCARCGALYHRKGVPNRCVGCRRKLRIT